MSQPRFTGTIDAQLQLFAGGVVAASANEPALDLGSGYAPNGPGQPMTAVIPFTTIKLSAGNETYSFKIQDSPDGATNWVDRSAARLASDDSIATTDGQSGEIALPCCTINEFVRLVITLGGTSPSITLGACYLSPITNARP